MDGLYTLVVTDGNNCSSLAANVDITVHTLPVINMDKMKHIVMMLEIKL